MRQAIVKVVIVLFALGSVLVVGLIVFGDQADHYEELDVLAARFEEQPTAEHLRDLLNYPADGAYSYYQGALTGAAFANHPEIFRSVLENLKTEQERFRIEQLRLIGAGVFEYHPELKPAGFERCFEECSWIVK